mmetsp:Transcript_28618/g.56226  ORF Transcript_28618/g.56226 Transcript_28618/m.56226 type:complete len:156 (+) Transcript_28618:14-481(+)
MICFISLCSCLFACAFDLGTFIVDGNTAVDMTATAKELLSQLDFARGILVANATLGMTERTSFHMFVTNRTEACHYHIGDTTSTVLHGRGRFYNIHEGPISQPLGSVYFIPKHTPHAFGHVGDPTIVMVTWSPPNKNPATYTVPWTGCKDLPTDN